MLLYSIYFLTFCIIYSTLLNFSLIHDDLYTDQIKKQTKNKTKQKNPMNFQM